MPKTAITLRTFNNVCSAISAIRLRFDVLSKIGLIFAAMSGRFALTASAPPSGSSISSTSDRAICAGFTETPGSSIGNTSGRYPTVIDHQQHHESDGKREIASGDLCEFWQEGRAAGQAQQQQADPHRLVQTQDSRQREGGERHHDEVRHERQHDQPPVAQRRDDLAHPEPEAHAEHAREDEHDHRNGDGRLFQIHVLLTRP